MAARTNQLIATGLEPICEALAERGWSADTKTKFWDYVNQAIQIARPTHTVFQLTKWFNQALEDDQGQPYRADVLICNFELRNGAGDKDPYTGQCAFDLSPTGYVRSLVACYDVETQD